MGVYPQGCDIGAKRFIGKRIGHRGQGSIFLIENDKRCMKHVMKVSHRAKCDTLRKEKRVYTKLNPLNNTIGFPKVYNMHYGMNYTGLTMEKLDSNLFKLRKQMPDRKFSDHTTIMLGIQCVKLLQSVHNTGYLHRGIKPHNFVMGYGERKDIVHLVDMGLAKRFRDENGIHSRKGYNEPLEGTRQFNSIDAQLESKLSRRDDMISLGYTLAYLRLGKLPWTGKSNCETICLKSEYSPKMLSKNLPEPFENYFNHVYRLTFSECPDYLWLIKIFEESLHSLGLQDNQHFDWNVDVGYVGFADILLNDYDPMGCTENEEDW